MKLFKNLVNAVAVTLQDIFSKNRYADKALEKLFKQNPQWGSRDRKFVAEGVYEIVRNFRLYSTLAESENNFWFITSVWLVVNDVELPAWPEFKHVNVDAIRARKTALQMNLPVYHSFPDWLWELGNTEMSPEQWQNELLSMNQQAPVYLRVNTLRTTLSKTREALLQDNITTEDVAGVPSALRLAKRENIFQNRLFKDGWFEVQDAGSQLIGDFLEPKPGEVVIDACAGAGGKSLHIAALMQNKGKVISLDVENWKLDELKKRARRANAFNIETRLIEGSATINSLAGKADRLLLDVPCSGLGVLRRNPDAKWKLSPEIILKTKLLQQQILNDYAVMVKPGGILVYSTCSILPSENRSQVDGFLEGNKQFQLIREKAVNPSEGFDGFYMALLKRDK